MDETGGYSKFKIYCLGDIDSCVDYITKNPVNRNHTIAHTTFKMPEGIFWL